MSSPDAMDTDGDYEAPSPSIPITRIPVEIFELITSFLSHRQVRNLRLVCRELEEKVSSQYFRNVVVPFRSELYHCFNRDGNVPNTPGIFTNGMRIFQSFGPHIVRFALSLELHEDVLKCPPLKPAQQAVPTFWGIYRWPHETYLRYSDLEGLEQTADETQSMKEALKYLTKVNNIGLCCDAGLGFLLGPDEIAHAATSHQRLVFAIRDWRRSPQKPLEEKKTLANNPLVAFTEFQEARQKKVAQSPSADPHLLSKRNILERMVGNAGFSKSQTDEAVSVLLHTEGTTLPKIRFDERPSKTTPADSHFDIASLMDEDVQSESEVNIETGLDGETVTLIPNNLTRAQMELLLELEWAHRAMMHSYVISMIDNSSTSCYQNLSTLTIAKIPSCHVNIFYNKELWSSLSSLKNVSVGIIADWRRIHKGPSGVVEDVPVTPMAAVEKAYKLLQCYIGQCDNIESIHFEWICGGEFAPSFYQRNMFILPAPFLEDYRLQVDPDVFTTSGACPLSLPYVKHLSLKNCWIAPHVLLQTTRLMALASLEKLELESVSLTGPPSVEALPPLTIQSINAALTPLIAPGPTALQAAALFGLDGQPPPQLPWFLGPAAGGDPNASVPPLPPLSTLAPTHPIPFLPDIQMGAPSSLPQPRVRMRQPDWLTWAGIVDHFSPAAKARDTVVPLQNSPTTIAATWNSRLELVSAFVPQSARLVRDEANYKLTTLSLRSCGYVVIDAPHVNSYAILPRDVRGWRFNPMRDRRGLSGYMQTCSDGLLGYISPYTCPFEKQYLESGYGMQYGWEDIYDDETQAEVLADGYEHGGVGRISGVVEADVSAR